MGAETARQVNLGALEDYDQERSISLREARELIRGQGPRDEAGRAPRVNYEVLRRWARHGCRPQGKDGPVLLLPTVLISGKHRAMPSWVEAFRLTREQLGRRLPPAPAPIERPARRKKAGIRLAEQTLDQAGIGTAKKQ